MITVNGSLRFGGHHAQDASYFSRTSSHDRLPRSTGPFGSGISLASSVSRRSDSSTRTVKGERKPVVVGELSQFAYQQALQGAQAYLRQTLQVVNCMNISTMQGKETQQNLLTQIRSTEIDAYGAAMILSNLNQTSEAFEDLQKDLQRLIQSHHKLVDTVRQDPRFDRRA